MQNRPSQVNSWTTASCRIVTGISRMEALISLKRGPSPRRPRRARSHAAGSSGGNSPVVTTVHSTARKKTTAPTWKEYFTESGTPLDVLPCTPNQLNNSGKAFARLAPTPMKNDCRSEEHTSELQSRPHLVCRLLLEKKKRYRIGMNATYASIGGVSPFVG